MISAPPCSSVVTDGRSVTSGPVPQLPQTPRDRQPPEFDLE